MQSLRGSKNRVPLGCRQATIFDFVYIAASTLPVRAARAYLSLTFLMLPAIAALMRLCCSVRGFAAVFVVLLQCSWFCCSVRGFAAVFVVWM
jgi:hypothetical protein